MKITKLLLVLNLAVILFSCSDGKKQNSKTEPEAVEVNPNEVTIEYTNEINGYFVKVLWEPREELRDHIIGSAKIEFLNKQNNTSFTIENDNFSILTAQLPLKFEYNDESTDESIQGTEIIGVDKNEVKLVYDNSNTANNYDFGTTNVPFFFEDLDFDNVEELLIVEYGNGQRQYATFSPYKLDENGIVESALMSGKPMTELDETTKFDKENMTVTIYKSGGASASEYEVYELVSSENEGEESTFVLK